MKADKEIYEKAGLFYIGKDVDKENFEPTDALMLLKNKNFTTHTAIIGMTGSGKTGLGIGLIEEAALDNIPSIVIDPKGDMGDMLLTDSAFSAEKFEPWVREEARSKGEDSLDLAQKTAKIWKEGIESWGQNNIRVERFSKVDKTIYTPGSTTGVGINILSSLEKPPVEIMEDADHFTAYISSTVSALLALVDIEADPLESKEFILLSQIIARAWRNDVTLGLDTLVGAVIQPSFKKIGVLPLESFYPQSERFKLATKFNSVIASPVFMGWLCGESLDIQKLLYDKNGKAKVAIFSIAHLNDSQRMFFVSLLLNKIVAWMRRQSGSSRLKAMLYMDEIYGFFPPVKNPPSKEPMITLLKQARAYGIGVILSTQNPVDLDYKGLSNIGTWFIGRLQTRQDIKRVIDGLDSKIASGFSKDEIANLLANLKKRTFFLKSAHLQGVRLFTTRWALSYLKGPLKKDDISQLMASKKEQIVSENVSSQISSENSDYVDNIMLKGNIIEKFEDDLVGKKHYTPTIATCVNVQYIDTRRAIQQNKELRLYINIDGANSCSWKQAQELEESLASFSAKAPKKAKFRHLPIFVAQDTNLKNCVRELKNNVYISQQLELYRCKRLRLESEVGESYDDFTLKVEDVIRDKFEEELAKVQERYKAKFERVQAQINRAESQLDKEKSDQRSSLITAGMSIVGAFFGGASLSKIGTAVNRSSRVLKERGDISRVQAKLENLQVKREDLKSELEEKIDKLDEKYSIENYEIQSVFIKPKKSAIEVKEIALLWRVEY